MNAECLLHFCLFFLVNKHDLKSIWKINEYIGQGHYRNSLLHKIKKYDLHKFLYLYLF